MRQTPPRFKAPSLLRSARMPSFQRHVFVCINERPAGHPKGCCKARGGVEVRDRLKEELAARGLAKRIRANNAGCLDQCEAGVAVVVYPEQVWYGNVTVADIPEIVDKHLIGGEVVARLLQPNQPHLGDRTTFPPIKADAPERAGGAAGEPER
jgi:(2Fe-2S) ferredoxin